MPRMALHRETRHLFPVSNGMWVEIRFMGRATTPADMQAVRKYFAFAKKQVRETVASARHLVAPVPQP